MTMKLLTKIATVCLLTATAALASCGRTAGHTASAGIVKIIGDESVENIIRQEVQVFELKYPASILKTTYTDAATAMDSIMSLKIRLAIVPHKLTPEQEKYLHSKHHNAFCKPIAVDAVAIIANTENPIQMLSLAQLSDILTGKITDWNELSPNESGKIAVVFDHQGSSTVQYMKDSIMGGKPFGKNVFAQKTNKDVFEAVKNRKGAIGIIGVSWLSRDLSGFAVVNNYSKSEIEAFDKSSEINHEISSRNLEAEAYQKEIKVIPIRKNDSPYPFKPFQLDIYTGDYPLFRTVYAICTAPNGSLEHGVFTFLTSILGQKVILNTGILPANMPPQRSVVINQE